MSFFTGLEELLDATRTEKRTYLLMVSQDLSATLYPLLIRLHLKDWLSRTDGDSAGRSLLELLELVDLRVFKLRGTNPQAGIAWIAHQLPNSSAQQVTQNLLNFCERWMPDALMASRLMADEMYRHPGLQRILLEGEEQARSALQWPMLSIAELVSQEKVGLSVEHILPQEPSFDITAYGFSSRDEYLQHLHRLGNLLLLEQPINSACNNSTVEQKITAPNLYHSSNLRSVGALAARHAGQACFQKVDVNSRSQTLAEMVAVRWSIGGGVAADLGASVDEDDVEGLEMAPAV